MEKLLARLVDVPTPAGGPPPQQRGQGGGCQMPIMPAVGLGARPAAGTIPPGVATGSDQPTA